MAKARRRKYRRYLRGAIDDELALVTLAGGNVVSQVVSDTLEEKAWLSSVKAIWSMIDFSPGTSDGPILVGVAHSDYTAAEIEEWIENSGSWTSGDKISQEIARRKIRRVGVFANLSASAAAADALNDGRPITTKCNWQLTSGQTLRFWAYNQGSNPLTSGAVVHLAGHANLWPN